MKPMALPPLPTFPPGSRGPAIAKLQQYLKQALMIPLTVDGVYGPETVAAVKALQRAALIPADGIAGPRTWTALSERLQMSLQISAADIAATVLPTASPPTHVEIATPSDDSGGIAGALPLLGLLGLLLAARIK